MRWISTVIRGKMKRSRSNIRRQRLRRGRKTGERQLIMIWTT
jgi:hypothetical protein